jgi:hypothetical protein
MVNFEKAKAQGEGRWKMDEKKTNSDRTMSLSQGFVVSLVSEAVFRLPSVFSQRS